MQLLNDQIKQDLPKIYAQEETEDKIVHVKFFTPWSNWTWFITEGQQEDGDFLLFGFVCGHEKEWGYVSLNELQSIKGPYGLEIERDLYFSPKPISQIPEISGRLLTNVHQ